MYKTTVIFFLLFIVLLFESYAYTINIQVTKKLLDKPVVQYAVEDVRQLLKNAGAEAVTLNQLNVAEVQIILQDVEIEKIAPITSLSYPVVAVVDRTYQWVGKKTDGQYILTLKTKSYEGISAALYGLLQEIFDFNFYHPRATKYPDLSVWKLNEDISYFSAPRFNKMGFHLHTMHPIELTEALLDENFPDGEQRIKEYIDWLVRNRQNYMEFNLLETINRKTWPTYAQKWVDYMINRGIIPGLDLSLHMKQQSAFKLYRNIPKSFKSKQKQIKERFEQLTQVGWKYWNVEFSETEFSSGNATKKAILRDFVHKLLYGKGIHLTGRAHVVKPETMVDKGGVPIVSEKDTLDRYRGTMIHTVMFYTLNDTLAPVYGNHNLQHMRTMLLSDREQRETWYYPESAYWVTFDNSIPLFLTPYLNGRLEDILYCDSLNIEGHLTFSSGWEWTYWLIDWSIANWSWQSSINNIEVVPYPEQYFNKLITSKTAQKYFKQVNELQNLQIKANNLMQYLTATTVTDEMPLGKNLPLHPIPSRTYPYIRNKASAEVLDSIEKYAVAALFGLSDELQILRQQLTDEDLDMPMFKEIIESLDMLTLRLQHRANTLSYLIAYRRAKINKDKSAEILALQFLEKAKSIRLEGIGIVKKREAGYRYPIQELTTQREDHTSYHFGYLYPVHNLHFWEREEEQALNNKWKFWYKNIWNIWRIIGIIK